jgi:hypothetical protein
MKSAAHQYEDKLLEFAYGELPRHEADAVDAHVRGCARCAEALAEIRGVRASMSQLPREAAPDAGLDSLLAYAEQAANRNAEAKNPAPSGWRRLLMPLASVAALATVGVISFRANQEFDTSPAAAAADHKVEAFEKKQYEDRAELAMKDRAPRGSANEAPAPMEGGAQPVAATPMPAAEPAADALAEQAFGDRNELGSERGRLDGTASRETVPQSVTKRKAPSKAVGPAPVDLSTDYSNAAQRGALAKEPAQDPLPPPPAQAAALADKGSMFGLGTGSAANVGQAPAPKAPVVEGKARSKKDEAYLGGSEAAPARVEAAKPAPPAAVVSAPPPKKSYGLRPMASSSAGATDDEDAALQRVDSMGLDRDAKFSERERAQVRARTLEEARVAAGRGDRSTELRLAAEVLSSGATGSERAEALKRLCDAWEALGDLERADPFCDQLQSEFPNSTAARLVAERRNRSQRALRGKAAAGERAQPAATPPARE